MKGSVRSLTRSLPAAVYRYTPIQLLAPLAQRMSSVPVRKGTSPRPDIKDNFPHTFQGNELNVITTKPQYRQPEVKVNLASKESMRRALENPETVILDVRSMEEIAETGYWKPSWATTTRWANAPGTRQDNFCLSVASKAILPNTDAPVIVYCARGFRSAKAKEILDAQGYSNVLNAGGYPADTDKIV